MAEMPDDLPIRPQFIVPDPDFEAPTLEGTVEGWRAWSVSTRMLYGVPPKLYSVTARRIAGGYWPPRQGNEAHCDKCGENLPGERCACGFYSAKTLRHLMKLGYHLYSTEDGSTGSVKVVGQVANWGKVIEGTQGWRSQFSYPIRLYVPFEAAHLAGPLKKAYGCRVKLLNFLKQAGQVDQQGIL